MKHYQHIFFDLDHTLWDFERSSEETINELFELLQLHLYIPTAKQLYISFEKANRWVWDQYHLDLLGKEALRTLRFEMAFEENGLTDLTLSEKISDMYLDLCPTKPYLLPGSIEILEYLASKYPLHLISNGFEESTFKKVKSSSLLNYFKTITTPSSSGYKKPQPEMFRHALNGYCLPHQAIMIGDDLHADILGAQKFGIDQVYFNPKCQTHPYSVTFEISHLLELRAIL